MMSMFDQRLTWALAAIATGFSAPLSAEPASGEFSVEFPTETAAIVAATSALFDAVETADVLDDKPVPVIRLTDIATKASVDTGVDKADPLTERGPLQHLTGYRISWYPVERFLGSVDFMGTWDGNRNLVCGYLTWDLTEPAAPVLETVMATYIDMGELVGATPEAIHETLLEANCAFGAIEANYQIFDPQG
ncbi:MAG: hypothetical protein HKN18_11935 [Silicimonas sp.]|nr:hypothetical protein [Silicimonas sp.]